MSYAGKTISYNLTGGTAGTSDFSGSATGTVTLDALSKAYVSVPVTADSTTEGSETLVLSSGGASASVTVNDTSLSPPPATYALAAGSTTVAEGSPILFTLSTTGVAAGSTLSYKVTGTGSAAGLTASGVATIDSSGKAVISLIATSNTTIGDTGAVTVELLNGSASATATVTDASPTTFTAVDVAAVNALGSPVTVTVSGTTAQSINVLTDQVAATKGITLVSASAPLTVTTGAQGDVITLVSGANNSIISGAGADSVSISGSGANSINVGAGADTVLGGSGSDTIRVGSGDLGIGDSIDGGDGTDTLIISGTGNVIASSTAAGAVLKNIENVVLDGTELTVKDLTTLAKLKSIQGSSATSEVTIDLGTYNAAQTIDLTGTSLTTLKTLKIDGTGGAGVAVTIKADAADLQAIGSFTKGTGVAAAVGLQTDVAGFKALSGITTATVFTGGTKTVVDTVDNLVANATALTGATLKISGSATDAQLAQLAASGLSVSATITASVSDLIDAIQYPDKKAAYTSTGKLIKVEGSATVAQALDLISNFGTQIANYQSDATGNKGISIVDTAANVAAQLTATGTTYSATGLASSGVNVATISGIAYSGATTAAGAEKLSLLASTKASGSYAVSDTATNLNSAITTSGSTITVPSYLSGATSLSLSASDRVVSTAANALELKALGTKLTGGYDLTLTLGAAASTDELSAIAGATKATISYGTVNGNTLSLSAPLDASQVGAILAQNANATVPAVKDSATTIANNATILGNAVTTDVLVTGSATVAQAAQIKGLIDKVVAKVITGVTHSAAGVSSGVSTNTYTISDAASSVLDAANAATVKAASAIAVTGTLTLEQAIALKALADASSTDKLAFSALTYSISDSVANIATQLGSTNAATKQAAIDVLHKATTVAATGTATIEQATLLTAAYNPTGDSTNTYVIVDTVAIADTVSNVFNTGAATLKSGLTALLAKPQVTGLSVSGALSVDRMDMLLDTKASTSAASATTTQALSVADATGVQVGMSVSGTGVTAGTTVTAISGTNITLSSAASVSSGAAVSFSWAGKFDKVYAVSDTNANLATSVYAGGNATDQAAQIAQLNAATSLTTTGVVTGTQASYLKDALAATTPLSKYQGGYAIEDNYPGVSGQSATVRGSATSVTVVDSVSNVSSNYA